MRRNYSGFELLLILFFPTLLCSQVKDTVLQLVRAIPIQSIYATTDNLQNIYIATEKGQVLKYNKNGEKLYEYNNNRLGQIGKIDAANPFVLLLYYPDFQLIILLDRTMSEIKKISLFDLGILEPRAIAMANDNHIWLFDQVSAVLKKVHQAGQVLFESRNLNQILGQNIRPVFMLERHNQLFLSDPENGLFIFDIFGQLLQKIPIKGIRQFQAFENQLIYAQEGQLHSIILDVLKKNRIRLPSEKNEIQDVNIQGNLMFIAQKECIKVYKKIE